MFGLLLFSLISPACTPSNRPTSVMGPGVAIAHNPNIQTPPQVSTVTQTEEVVIPPGSKIVVAQTDSVAASATNPAIPSHRETTIELPRGQGAKIVTNAVKTDARGSGGFAPPPPPTPFQKSLTVWTYVGAALIVGGIFFCTPWGGQNYRCGAIVAGGGVAMALSASFIDQFKLPHWFPAVFLLSLLFALAVYWGYRVRHKQVIVSPTV